MSSISTHTGADYDVLMTHIQTHFVIFRFYLELNINIKGLRFFYKILNYHKAR